LIFSFILHLLGAYPLYFAPVDVWMVAPKCGMTSI